MSLERQTMSKLLDETQEAQSKAQREAQAPQETGIAGALQGVLEAINPLGSPVVSPQGSPPAEVAASSGSRPGASKGDAEEGGGAAAFRKYAQDAQGHGRAVHVAQVEGLDEKVKEHVGELEVA